MRKILVPTDFSNQADNALDFAYQVAKGISAEIELLHVLDISSHTNIEDVHITGEMRGSGIPEEEVYYIKLVEKSRNDLIRIENDPKYDGVKIWHKLMQGSPGKAIYQEADDRKVSLIVMGTTGTHGWEEELVGSNAEKVVRRSTCPVVTLSEPQKLKEIKNIAFASDFENPNKDLNELVMQIADFTGATLNLVRVNTPNDFKNDKLNKAIIKSFAVENGFTDYQVHVFNGDNEEDGIVMFAEEFNMDMIIMATEGRTGFARVLEGSIAEDVVNYSKIPVLTFNTSK